jgi:superfamily I DNA/RNA helicase
VPLPEVLSEIAGSGPGTKTVERGYDRVLATLGPELFVLEAAPVEDIARAGSSLLAEAVTRLRSGQVIREAGYDGEYGVIRLFDDAELKRLTGGDLLFEAPRAPARSPQTADRLEAPKPVLPEEVAQPASTAIPQGLLDGLDDDQRAAARLTQGALLIIAGPGSGKTRTLTHRIAHLIADCGIPAERCLAITFTRRAATELRERLAALLPRGFGEVAVHTFHSLGLTILRQHAEEAGLRPGFRLAGEAERVSLLAQAMQISARKAERLVKSISTVRRTGEEPDHDLAAALTAYRGALTARNWIDFDDLVVRCVHLLEADPALAGRWSNQFGSVSVDEFQDVDATQYRLLRLLAPRGNLCVIGDPDQAIYGFRGADAGVFERFRRDYPDAATIRLARNYRSTGTIVRASGQVIGATTDGDLAAVVRDMHERITIHAAPTEAAEAEFIVQTIEGLIGGHTFFSIDSGRAGDGSTDLSFADIAVLYRTEAQSGALHEALSRSGIPFKTSSPSMLGDNPVVMALLRELDATAADQPISRLLANAAAALEGREGMDPSSLSEAVRRLKSLAASVNDGRERFFETIALSREWDLFDPSADRVSLMTMHAAKGLEFAVVFVVGLEDGLMPLRFGGADAAEAEERRLLYVAMTRAKDRLYLTRSQSRLWRGRLRKPEPSPLLADIEAELTRQHRSQWPRRKFANRQLELF